MHRPIDSKYKRENELLSRAIKNYQWGDEEASWNWLLLWADHRYSYAYERSKAQKEIQKLWIERGFLERMRINLQTLHDMCVRQPAKDIVIAAQGLVKAKIYHNQQTITEISRECKAQKNKSKAQ